MLLEISWTIEFSPLLVLAKPRPPPAGAFYLAGAAAYGDASARVAALAGLCRNGSGRSSPQLADAIHMSAGPLPRDRRTHAAQDDIPVHDEKRLIDYTPSAPQNRFYPLQRKSSAFTLERSRRSGGHHERSDRGGARRSVHEARKALRKPLGEEDSHQGTGRLYTVSMLSAYCLHSAYNTSTVFRQLRAQAGSDARARRSRRGAGVDSCRPCFVWSCA
jgi:hypothetical protein